MSAEGTTAALSPGRERSLLVGLVLLAAVLRIWNLGVWPGFSGDEGRDVYFAWQVAETGTFQLHPVRPYFGPWQLWLTAPFIKLLGVSPFSARLPLALLGILVVPLAAAIGRRLGGPAAGLAAAALAAVAPIHVLFARLALSVSALPALVLATWWAWQRLRERHNPRHAALMGFFLGAAVAFHPQAMAVGLALAASLAATRDLRALVRVDLAVGALLGFAALGWVSWDVILDQVGLGPGIDYSGTWVDANGGKPFVQRLVGAVPITADVFAGGRLLHWVSGPSSADPPGELLGQLLVAGAFVAATVRTARTRSPEALALLAGVATIWLLTVVRSSDFDLSGLSRERYLLTTLVLATPWLAWGLVGSGQTRLDRVGAGALVLLLIQQTVALSAGFFAPMATTGGDAEPSFVAARPDVKVEAAAWIRGRLGADEEGLLLAGDSWSYWPVIAVAEDAYPSDYVPEDPAVCAEILRTRDHRRRWLMDFAGWYWNDAILRCLALAGLPDLQPAFVGRAEDDRPLLLIWELPPGTLDALD